MELIIVVDEHEHKLEIDLNLIEQAESFFQKMDADMDKGYQMSRTWVDNPDIKQRCQIVADRLYTALGQNNESATHMMAAYILSRAPRVKRIVINTEGDMTEHVLAAY